MVTIGHDASLAFVSFFDLQTILPRAVDWRQQESLAHCRQLHEVVGVSDVWDWVVASAIGPRDLLQSIEARM